MVQAPFPDDLEHNDESKYVNNNAGGSFSIQTSRVAEGSYSLEISGDNSDVWLQYDDEYQPTFMKVWIQTEIYARPQVAFITGNTGSTDGDYVFELSLRASGGMMINQNTGSETVVYPSSNVSNDEWAYAEIHLDWENNEIYEVVAASGSSTEQTWTGSIPFLNAGPINAAQYHQDDTGGGWFDGEPDLTTGMDSPGSVVETTGSGVRVTTDAGVVKTD